VPVVLEGAYNGVPRLAIERFRHMPNDGPNDGASCGRCELERYLVAKDQRLSAGRCSGPTASVQRRLGRELVCEGNMCLGHRDPDEAGDEADSAQTPSVRCTDHLTRKSRTAASTAMAGAAV
jgi:hypothetical protein